MKPYDETVDMIRSASEPLQDEPWDFGSDSRDLDIPGRATGRVSVHENMPDRDGSAFVSLELHGLSAEQACAVLHVLSRKPRDSFESANLTTGEFNEP